MKPLKVNLLDSGTLSHRGSSSSGRTYGSQIIILIVFFASFAFGRMTLSMSPSSFDEFDNIPILSQMRHLIGSPDRKLGGEAANRINILLLGMGGEGHEGPNLTDTIILASINPTTRQAALLSVPRDMLVPVDGQGWRKINAANAFGELAAPGRGGDATRAILEQIFGMDIPYYVRLDFDGFRDIVDSVDGIDVYVERNFTDTTYPAANFATQAVSFKEGWQHMDGDTALKFTRSRHGSNGEGTDFARAKRQQKVITALKENLLSFETLKNPARVSTILASLRAHVATNLQIGEILRLAKIGSAMDRSAITHKVLDAGADSPLAE
ncbi:MAG: LCP family protein, partial [Patescibacteria group bacterium]